MSNNQQKIKCPKCGESISIDDVLTRQISEEINKEIEEKQKIRDVEIAQKEKELKIQFQKLEEEKSNNQIDINKKVIEKIAEEKIILWKKAKTEATKETASEKRMLEEQLADKDKKLQEAIDKEITIRKEKNKLEEAKKSFELEKQRQLDEERIKISEDASKKATEEQQHIISQLKKQLADAIIAKNNLARKLEQGSQQTQGEVQELELEEILKTEFPEDDILPVPKGKKGADIIQKVMDRHGRLCGQIVWESKKTKAWSNGWIQKLKDDQRIAKAEIAVIVSNVIPDDVRAFRLVDGVFICDIKFVVGLATLLRINLESITKEKAMSIGKNEKMEILYAYLTGVEFKQRVEAIVETFSDMGEVLKRERVAYEKMWQEREKQIQKVIKNTVGMYGDMSGLVSLPQIKILELGDGANVINGDTDVIVEQ